MSRPGRKSKKLEINCIKDRHIQILEDLVKDMQIFK